MKEIIGEECFKILDNEEYILFYFGAEWCGPCQKVLPLMDDLIQTYDQNKISFYKIDIDNEKNRLICDKCKIKSVPAFLLFKDRTFIDRVKGGNIHIVEKMINTIIYPEEEEEEEEEVEEGVDENKQNPFMVNQTIFNKNNLFKK